MRTETRERLIEAGLELFLEEGFHKVTLARLGSKLGITHAALYAHFDDKTDLLSACCDASIRRIRELVDEAIDPNAPAADRLRDYLAASLGWVGSHRAYANALLSMYYYAACDDGLRKLHARVDEDTISRIETHLIQGNRERAWKVAAPRATAAMIHSLIVGELIKIFHRPREQTRTERLENLWSTVEAMVRVK